MREGIGGNERPEDEVSNHSSKRVVRSAIPQGGPSTVWEWLSSVSTRRAPGGPGYSEISEPSVRSSIPRKVPVKVEPKVFFANERTYLAWLHMAVSRECDKYDLI